MDHTDSVAVASGLSIGLAFEAGRLIGMGMNPEKASMIAYVSAITEMRNSDYDNLDFDEAFVLEMLSNTRQFVIDEGAIC